MSDTTNHKKAIAITRSCRGNRGLITDIYYKILEDHPAAIVNAFEELKKDNDGSHELGVKCHGCGKRLNIYDYFHFRCLSCSHITG